ncbi:hypothetical protein GCM10027570_42830 [Streptomonospora sediminis]
MPTPRLNADRPAGRSLSGPRRDAPARGVSAVSAAAALRGAAPGPGVAGRRESPAGADSPTAGGAGCEPIIPNIVPNVATIAEDSGHILNTAVNAEVRTWVRWSTATRNASAGTG